MWEYLVLFLQLSCKSEIILKRKKNFFFKKEAICGVGKAAPKEKRTNHLVGRALPGNP